MEFVTEDIRAPWWLRSAVKPSRNPEYLSWRLTSASGGNRHGA